MQDIKKKVKAANLCSGIGGFELGLKLACQQLNIDYEIIALCEKDDFCCSILQSRFPNVPIINNIFDFTKKNLEKIGIDTEIDLLTGSPPCQSFSHAGKRKVHQDDRNLFPEVFRIIDEFHPRAVVLENVRGLFTAKGGEYFKYICCKISTFGYDISWQIIPACAVGAIHRRERIWIVAMSHPS